MHQPQPVSRPAAPPGPADDQVTGRRARSTGVHGSRTVRVDREAAALTASRPKTPPGHRGQSADSRTALDTTSDAKDSYL
jgi:hypothetical protein